MKDVVVRGSEILLRLSADVLSSALVDLWAIRCRPDVSEEVKRALEDVWLQLAPDESTAARVRAAGGALPALITEFLEEAP